MKTSVIHKSGEGADLLSVTSLGNGWAYSFEFGAAGHPMRNLFMQDEDAAIFREKWETAEASDLHKSAREILLDLLDPYL